MPEKKPVENSEDEEYELLPHKEIEELKDELKKLKEFEITPTKQMQVSIVELNKKLDKLITIFEDAIHQVKVEEGGLSFAEKMKPLLEKMNKILEQNSEIASGILAVADMIKELKGEEFKPKQKQPQGLPPLPGRAHEPLVPSIPPPPRPIRAAPVPPPVRPPVKPPVPPRPVEAKGIPTPPPRAPPVPPRPVEAKGISTPPPRAPPVPPRPAEANKAPPRPPAPEGPPLPPLPRKRTFGL
ncbi:hypothetical protein B6U93_00080 [Candidatus Woesearchaeota archaeon ex4484_78]|nr:MAG: hypothetical protein B6U93_00080 [Candidatus Woesearchaeota archaeon ex4484_78]